MENQPAITVFDSNPKIRRIITEALHSEGLETICRVEDSAALSEEPNEETIPIILCEEGQPPPPLKIPESDIFTKPLRLGRLLDRIEWHRLGHARKNREAPLEIGPYDLDTVGNRLTGRESGKSFRLTGKETAILRILHEHKGAALAREKLLEEVWGYAENIETHTLETHIYRLRQKIEDDASDPRLLLTEENGYRLRVEGVST